MVAVKKLHQASGQDLVAPGGGASKFASSNLEDSTAAYTLQVHLRDDQSTLGSLTFIKSGMA